MNEHLPLISINILSFNRRDVLRYTLAKIFAQDYKNIEVIVIDNGSSDKTSEMIKNEFPNVKLIQLEKNIGIAGYNIGFKEVQGEFILILDDDSYPKTSTILKGIEKFEDDDSIGIVAFNIMNELENKSESYDFDEYPNSFIGCGALISKNLINRIGVYDENYFLYDNELDYAARCWDAGYKIYYLKSAVVVHLQSTIAREHSNKNILLGKKRYYHFSLSYSKFIVLRLSGKEKVKALIKWWINRTIIMIRFGYLKEYFFALQDFLKVIPKLHNYSCPINYKLQKKYGSKSFPLIDRIFFPNFIKPKLFRIF